MKSYDVPGILFAKIPMALTNFQEERLMKKRFIIGMAALLFFVLTLPAIAKVKIGGMVFTF